MKALMTEGSIEKKDPDGPIIPLLLSVLYYSNALSQWGLIFLSLGRAYSIPINLSLARSRVVRTIALK
jgi:hypothetical protein